MEKRNIEVTIETAKQWYNSKNETLKELALNAFSKNELVANYKNIKSFKDACTALNLNYDRVRVQLAALYNISVASVAMFEVNIIRKALNIGYDMHLIAAKGTKLYYPFNPIIDMNCNLYKADIDGGFLKSLGIIETEGKQYYVLGGYATNSISNDLSNFYFNSGAGECKADLAFLGCATKEIAKHFGEYFGMLITEAKYGDLKDFEIIRTF